MKTKPTRNNNIVPINKNSHLKIKMSELVNFSFSKTTNASILTLAEFEKGCKTYPLLFIKDAEEYVPVALFGLEDKQNLFLKWNNQWDADYIPAHIRRYPFSLATVEHNSEFIVCMDENATIIGKSGEHALFLANGKQSEFLNEKIRFLQELQLEYEKTLIFTRKILALDLFEPMNANVNLNNGENLTISGFYVINKDKFKLLDSEIYKEFVNNDEMKLIYEHFSSMGNFSKLIDIVAERKVISKGSRVPRKKTNELNNNKDSDITEKNALKTEKKPEPNVMA